MAKKKSAREIVQEAMPHVRVMPPLPQPLTDDAMSTTAPGSPSIEELRAKYLGSSDAAQPLSSDDVDVEMSKSTQLDELRRRFLGTAPNSPPVGDSASDDVEIVRVQSQTGEDNPESGPGVRTVIVSKSKGKIIGKQG